MVNPSRTVIIGGETRRRVDLMEKAAYRGDVISFCARLVSKGLTGKAVPRCEAAIGAAVVTTIFCGALGDIGGGLGRSIAYWIHNLAPR